ncbi:MAG: protein CpxP [Bacteriovoracaceae bacterium]|jgi:protein CpxP
MKAILSMILLGTLIAPTAFAEGRKGGKGEGKGFSKILKQLDLSDDQKVKLKELRKAKKSAGKSDHGELKKLREEMKSKFASSASESEIRALHNKIKTMRHAKGDERFSRVMEIRNILTVEQRKQFQSLQEERRGKKGKKKRDHK